VSDEELNRSATQEANWAEREPAARSPVLPVAASNQYPSVRQVLVEPPPLPRAAITH